MVIRTLRNMHEAETDNL